LEVADALSSVASGVASFIGKIESLQRRRRPAVASSYIFVRTAHRLCTELSRLIDAEEVRNSPGAATINWYSWPMSSTGA
jgi:hypothetical protein